MITQPFFPHPCSNPASVQPPRIRAATPDDAAQICDIYNPYILKTTITFEEQPLNATDIVDRIQQVNASGLPWLVLEDTHPEDSNAKDSNAKDGNAKNILKGYCYASPWKNRTAYRYTVETSIYLQENDRQQGWGSLLYGALLQQLQTQGIHSAIGILALPNPASIRLHEKLGFEYAGQLKDAGFKFDRWIDVVYWQRIFT